MTSTGAVAGPRSAALPDAAVVAFAAWTLVCNAVALTGGSFRSAAVAGPIAVVAALALQLRLTRAGARVPRVDAERPGGSAVSPASLARVGSIAAAIVGLAVVFGSLTILWAGGVLLLGIPFLRHVARGAPRWIAASTSLRSELGLWALGVSGAVFGLAVQRPDHDDAYYLNVAASVADRPDAPLLAVDTLLGVPDLPSMFPVYKVQALELVAGWVAWATPLSGIEASHQLIPAVVGLLIPLAWARLLRIVAPERWFAAVAVLFAVFVLIGGSNVWHANMALVRMHQGKAVFVAAMVPLILAYALEYTSRPGSRTFVRLLLAQVASLGMTSTALWAGPVVAALGLAAGAEIRPRALARLLAGLAASAYPIAIALLLRTETAATLGFAGSEESQRIVGFDLYPLWQRLESAVDGSAIVAISADHVLGSGRVAVACVVSALVAWTTLPDGPGRRFALALPLGFLLFVANPFTAELVADHVTGRLTFERAFWLVPFPLFLALVVTAPLAWAAPSRPMRAAAVALLATLVLGLLPDARVVSRANGVRVEPMGLKVHSIEYEAARRVVAHAPPRSHVLAPNPVSVWIGSFHRAPHPLVPRRGYFRMYAAGLSAADVRARLALTSSLAYRSLPADSPKAELLRRGIDEYDVRVVCVYRSAHGTRQVLRDAGLRPVDITGPYEIWVR